MVKALQDVSLEINDKEFLLITGPSGSGKSTLMHIAGLLDVPDSGDMWINGKKVPEDDASRAQLRSEFLGFVFQNFALMPSLNVLDNITLPAVFKGANLEEEAKEIAESLGISHRLHHYTNEISGGERQRVAIARALINNPDIIFADEPTGNLDTKTGAKVMELLKSLTEDKGKTLVVVSHNPEHEAYADRVIRMRDGKLL